MSEISTHPFQRMQDPAPAAAAPATADAVNPEHRGKVLEITGRSLEIARKAAVIMSYVGIVGCLAGFMMLIGDSPFRLDQALGTIVGSGVTLAAFGALYLFLDKKMKGESWRQIQHEELKNVQNATSKASIAILILGALMIVAGGALSQWGGKDISAPTYFAAMGLGVFTIALSGSMLIYFNKKKKEAEVEMTRIQEALRKEQKS